MLRSPHLGLLAAFVGVASSAALGQWSSDPAVNTLIASGNSEQVQPKIRATTDGGCYVTYFDNQSGGYDVRVQRLDAAGEVQWPGGVLVADRSFSSTQDYGASVDTEGYSLLAFRDDRSGSQTVTAQRVSPMGDLLWGTGVTMPGSANGSVPRIAGTSDGGSVVAWASGSAVALVKLDSGGNVLWTRTVTGPGGVNVVACDVQASDAAKETGSFVLSMVRFGSFSTPRNLYAQKFDVDGNPLWGASPLTIYGTGSLQIGNFPPFVSDGAGGAVLSWYGTTGGLQSFVQRVFSDGTLQFPANGAPVATDAGRVRVAPSAAIDPSNGDIYCFWNELNSNQSQFGVSGQRFSGTDRMWGSGGLAVVPLGATDMQQIRTLPREGGADGDVGAGRRWRPEGPRLGVRTRGHDALGRSGRGLLGSVGQVSARRDHDLLRHDPLGLAGRASRRFVRRRPLRAERQDRWHARRRVDRGRSQRRRCRQWRRPHDPPRFVGGVSAEGRLHRRLE